MSYLTIRDHEQRLLVLDQTRRFTFTRKTVSGWVAARLSETRGHRDQLRERVYAAFSKADVPPDKAEGALDRLDSFGVEMDEALRSVYEDHLVGRALGVAIDGLSQFGSLLDDPACVIGTMLAAPMGGDLVGLNMSEVAFLRSAFNPKRFRDAIVPQRVYPATYGTAARRVQPMVGSMVGYDGVGGMAGTLSMSDLAKMV